jgi:hypothetical protein
MNYLEQSRELQETFDVPRFEMGEETIKSRILRLQLLFEELLEFAEAIGLEKSFEEMCVTHLGLKKRKDTDIIDKEATLDALCDLGVILFGTIHTGGFQDVYEPAMDEVHSSNMSKICYSMEEANQTVEKYKSIGRSVKIKMISANPYKAIILDAGTEKFLKGINFKEPDLKKFVE